MAETISFIRRNLPHWLVADRAYFVTIRLAGTLPLSVTNQMIAERERLHASDGDNEEALLDLQRRQFLKIEAILDKIDQDKGRRLTDLDMPDVILKSLNWLKDEAGWTIYAATVMPTHLHMVMRNASGRSGELLKHLEDFKRFTGRAGNRTLGSIGKFWARDDFDHWCRTPEKVEAAVRYVRQNPVKAGLTTKWEDWPWTVGSWVE